MCHHEAIPPQINLYYPSIQPKATLIICPELIITKFLFIALSLSPYLIYLWMCVAGIPFVYRGLPCLYSSAILASASLLSGGNTVLLRTTAVALILFMVSRSFYPHDRVLESQAWKKAIYAGGRAPFGWHISLTLSLALTKFVFNTDSNSKRVRC